MNKEETLMQICKMISSGEIPNEIYNKYLSKTPIGFMNCKDLYNYLQQENEQLQQRIDKAIEYIENDLWLHFETRHDYLTVRDNLLEILKGDSNE